MVETRGHLGKVTIDDGALTLEGWAATVGAGSVESFKVTCAGTELTNLEVAMGPPQPRCQSEPSLSRWGRPLPFSGACRPEWREAGAGAFIGHLAHSAGPTTRKDAS